MLIINNHKFLDKEYTIYFVDSKFCEMFQLGTKSLTNLLWHMMEFAT